MGYETKLIIGTLTDMKGHTNKDCDYVIPIAEINLCKTDCFVDTYIDREKDNHKVYVYGTDGDTEISKDRYDSQLFAINPDAVLNAMVTANKKNQYRRYQAAIPLLKPLAQRI